jgi:hypothetical protein
MARRVLALALILNLLALVPVPLSACAVVSGLDAQCQCSTPERCEPSLQTRSRKSGPAISCHCIQSQAPFPNALQNASHPVPAILTSTFATPAVPDRQVLQASLTDAFFSHLGPPGGRAALCVFLI